MKDIPYLKVDGRAWLTDGEWHFLMVLSSEERGDLYLGETTEYLRSPSMIRKCVDAWTWTWQSHVHHIHTAT
jgi:hypothetical protein